MLILQSEREMAMAEKTVASPISPATRFETKKDSTPVVIKYGHARRGQITLDVFASEVDELASKGRKGARRGRRPKSEAA